MSERRPHLLNAPHVEVPGELIQARLELKSRFRDPYFDSTQRPLIGITLSDQDGLHHLSVRGTEEIDPELFARMTEGLGVDVDYAVVDTLDTKSQEGLRVVSELHQDLLGARYGIFGLAPGFTKEGALGILVVVGRDLTQDEELAVKREVIEAPIGFIRLNFPSGLGFSQVRVE